MRRRTVAGIAVGAVLLLGMGAAGGYLLLRPPHYSLPAHQIARPISVTNEIAYVERYWDHHNTAEYGDFGGTDCVNFTSQALLARGWPMTADWGHEKINGRNVYSRAWISSTTLMHYLQAHPELATALTDAQRSRVRVGDVVQFDWDRSGDRDHTAVVSKVDASGDLSFDGHSPDWHNQPVDQVIADHPHVAIFYWHLLR